MRAIRTAMDSATFLEGIATCRFAPADEATPVRRCSFDHVPTFTSTIMPSKAANENQPTLDLPLGMTIRAASSGPIAHPGLPRTGKNDRANPCCAPDAERTTPHD